MLLREIIKPMETSITVTLPEEMVGKTVELLAFEIDPPVVTDLSELRLLEIERLTKDSLVDLSGFKFDRDQANDYDA